MKYARRALYESWTILATWCIFCAVVLLVCAPAYLPVDAAATVTDSAPTDERVPTVLGFPRWVFWGIAVPWLVASTFTMVFAMRAVEIDPPTDIDSHIKGDGADA